MINWIEATKENYEKHLKPEKIIPMGKCQSNRDYAEQFINLENKFWYKLNIGVIITKRLNDIPAYKGRLDLMITHCALRSEYKKILPNKGSL